MLSGGSPCAARDPFAGAGTTLAVAARLGRRAVGIELKPEFVALAKEPIRSVSERAG
jgi:site-specific DNA-methyltransferase (adenine-specific)